jgi:hypothetical protein
MATHRMRAALAGLTLAASALAGSAHAVTVVSNPGGQLTTKLYNMGDAEDETVFLETQSTPNYLVSATGDQDLEVDGFGFALIDGAPTFDSITFDALNPLLGFQSFQFMVLDSNELNSNPAPTFKISWTTNLGAGSQFVNLSGNKNYQLDAGLNEIIETITLSNLTGYTGNGQETVGGQPGSFAQVKQLSFEGVSAIPEPATWTMMIAGFGLAGAALRRRRTLVTA